MCNARFLVATLAALALSACDDSPGSTPAVDAASDHDAPPGDGSTIDLPCNLLATARYATSGQTVDIFTIASIDTGSAWIVAYRGGGTAIWWTTVDHDGTVVTPPTRLDDGEQPHLARSTDGTRIALAYTDGTAHLLQFLTPRGALEGAAIALVDPAAQVHLDGVIAGPGTGYRAMWSHTIVPTQPPAIITDRDLYVQHLDAAGAPVGQATMQRIGGPGTGALAGNPDGTIDFVSDYRTTIGGCNACVTEGVHTITANDGVVAGAALPRDPARGTTGASFARAGDHRYVAWRSHSPENEAIRAVHVGRLPVAELAAIEAADAIAMTGTTATGGAITYRALAPIRAIVQRFADDTTFALGARCTMPHPAVALHRAGDDTVFAVGFNGDTTLLSLP